MVQTCMTPYVWITSQPISVVLVCLGLGVTAVTLTFACTWLTNRKRRVGHHVTNKHGSLILATGVPSGHTGRCQPTYGPSQYASSSPGLSPHHHHTTSTTNSSTIIHPSIIITPPTPLAFLVTSPSACSQWGTQDLNYYPNYHPPSTPPLVDFDSSIGSASDFITTDNTTRLSSSSAAPPASPPAPKHAPHQIKTTPESYTHSCMDPTGNQEEKRKLMKMRIEQFKYNDSVFDDMTDYDYRTIPSFQTDTIDIDVSNHQQDVGSPMPEVRPHHTMTSIPSGSLSSAAITTWSRDDLDIHRSSICNNIDKDNKTIPTYNDNTTPDEMVIETCNPRSRLSSIEPGTPRPKVFTCSNTAQAVGGTG